VDTGNKTAAEIAEEVKKAEAERKRQKRQKRRKLSLHQKLNLKLTGRNLEIFQKNLMINGETKWRVLGCE
jgi:hypothetical protein